jgi:TrmH family RNA methyltransferase
MLTKSQVKYIQSLNEKKLRQENGVFVAEGPKIIGELLGSSNLEPVALYGTSAWWQKNGEIRQNIPFVAFHEISDQELERISFLSTPHQVMGIFRQPVFAAEASFTGQVSLVLDGIQDPGNLGTMIRIADWFGIKHIIAGRDCADVFNPKVVQSTMGSLTRVNMIYEDLGVFLKAHAGIAVYAGTLHGKSLHSFDKIKEGFLLVGNESRGIQQELVQLATHHITIPKYGLAESLNAAVASGIILSHILDK